MKLNLPLLKDLDAKRTKGPWRISSGNDESITLSPGYWWSWAHSPSNYEQQHRNNAAFIVTIANSWPAILERLERAEAAVRSGLAYAAEVHNRGEDDDETCDALMRFDEHVATWRRLSEGCE